MGNIIRKHHVSFKNALAGIRWAFTTQPNFAIHIFFSIFAILLGWLLGLNVVEWILLVFTIIWGLSAEMINTAIEAMTDLITTEWRREAKIAKDVGAGMMLLTACGALFVAAILFLPKLIGSFL